jgi:hypothetical protein
MDTQIPQKETDSGKLTAENRFLKIAQKSRFSKISEICSL